MRLEEPEWYECAALWPTVEPWVKAALSHGGLVYTPDDILTHLLTRRMKLWIARDGEAIKGCCISVIERYERLCVCSVLVIGGTMAKDWLHFSEAVEDWGRSMGAEYMQGCGRFGWAKKASPLGYKPVAVIYRKAL